MYNKNAMNTKRKTKKAYMSFIVMYGWKDTVSLVSFGSTPVGLLDPVICNAITWNTTTPTIKKAINQWSTNALLRNASI